MEFKTKIKSNLPYSSAGKVTFRNEEKSVLKIPHEGGTIYFQHPSFRGHCGVIAESIDRENLKRPTSSKTTSLVSYAFENPDGKYQSEIIKILNNAFFREYTGLDYLPKVPKGKGYIHDGVIFWDDPLIDCGEIAADNPGLIKKLENAEEFKINGHPIFISKDRQVRFTPSGYKVGEMTSKELAENPFVIAQRLGRKGNELEHSEEIAKVASTYKNNPSIYGFSSVDEEKIRMSAVGSSWNAGLRFFIYGEIWNDGGEGRAYGEIKSGNIY